MASPAAKADSDGSISESLGKVALAESTAASYAQQRSTSTKMTPEQVEAIFKSTGPPSSPVQYPDDEPLPDDEKERRVLRLKEVLVAAQVSWASGGEDLDLLAEKVADGLRNPSWRAPMGESGLLLFFLDKVAKLPELPGPLRIQTLRVLGNSCADTDENRAMVVERNLIPIILDLPEDNLLLPFHIPVVYNICLDYEPAQLQACEANISATALELTCGPRVHHCHAFFNVMFKAWSLVAHREQELSNADPSIPIRLLGLITDPPYPLDAEDFTACITVLLAYLSSPRFQEAVVTENAVPKLLAAFETAETAYDPEELNPDDADLLTKARSTLVRILTDVSALPSFAQAYPLKTSPVVNTLRSWLAHRQDNINLVSTACIVLGNLARSDEASTWLVQEAQMHEGLIELLSPSISSTASSSTTASAASLPPAELIFSILSILKNLAIPPLNKPLLGSLLDSALPALWTSPDLHPQAQFAAVSLGRLLATGCAANVRRLCTPLSTDPDSPAAARSSLHVLASLVERVPTEPTRIESARLALAVCRLLHSKSEGLTEDILPPEWPSTSEAPESPSPFPPAATTSIPTYQSPSSPPSAISSPDPAGSTPAYSAVSTPLLASSPIPTSPTSSPPFVLRRARFYAAHADLKGCLSYLLQQSRFPVLRSEAWFVLALMSRSRDGAAVAVWALEPEEAVGALYKAVVGRDVDQGTGVLLLGEGEEYGKKNDGEDNDENADTTTSKSDDNKPSDAATSGDVLEKSAALQQELGLEPQQVETGAPSAQQKERMEVADRENGLVLITEVLRTFADQLPTERADLFRGLMREGGDVLAAEREKRKDAIVNGEKGNED